MTIETTPQPESPVRISVALCTYNGVANLRSQLASIAEQTRPPDELIICDDGSTDETMRIVEDFAGEAPFSVRPIANETNLGVTKNFEKAIGLCTGDVIALSDQDDVWMPQKLARIESAFEESPGAGLVFSDAECVDSDLQPLGYRLWPSVYIGPRQRRRVRAGGAFDLLLTHNIITGATAAFRSRYREMLLPIHGGWVHDGWIALLIAAVADVIAIDEPLVKYRQHAAQQIGAREPTLAGQFRHARTMGLEYFTREHGNFAAALDRLRARTEFTPRPGAIEKLAAKERHYRARMRMRQVGRLRRLPLIARELVTGRYFRYSINAKAIPQDLFL